MNPIFIPKDFTEIKEDGSKILYRSQLIDGKNIRVIEYYNEKGLLYRVNVWGICGRLEEFDERLVAWDKDIDFETEKKLRKPLEDIYSKEVKMMFF